MPPAGMNSSEAPVRRATRRRRSRGMLMILAFFAARTCFYALATSSDARHMSQFLNEGPWQYFKDTELDTMAGVAEGAWRIITVPLAGLLWAAFVVTTRLDEQGERRRSFVWEAALAMVGLEVMLQIW